VAEEMARRYGCSGPLITVSTACSSGAVAFARHGMLRRGKARRVLAGGVDSLCRLTYFGFNSLQLIDPIGARPLDRERSGLSLAEGAALLLLTTDPRPRVPCNCSAPACHATPTTPPPLLPTGRGTGCHAGGSCRCRTRTCGHRLYQPARYRNTRQTIWPRLAPSKPFSVIACRALLDQRGHGPCPGRGWCYRSRGGAIAIDHGIVPANVGFGSIDPALNLAPVTVPCAPPSQRCCPTRLASAAITQS